MLEVKFEAALLCKNKTELRLSASTSSIMSNHEGEPAPFGFLPNLRIIFPDFFSGVGSLLTGAVAGAGAG